MRAGRCALFGAADAALEEYRILRYIRRQQGFVRTLGVVTGSRSLSPPTARRLCAPRSFHEATAATTSASTNDITPSTMIAMAQFAKLLRLLTPPRLGDTSLQVN